MLRIGVTLDELDQLVVGLSMLPVAAALHHRLAAIADTERMLAVPLEGRRVLVISQHVGAPEVLIEFYEPRTCDAVDAAITAVLRRPRRRKKVTMPETATTEEICFEHVLLHQLVEGRHNVRKHFHPDRMRELAESIRQKGVLEPLVLRPAPPNGRDGIARYEIVAGARRFRAAQLAGNVERLPAVIRAYTDEDVLELQLIENLHRDDLDPMERARGFKALIDLNPSRFSARTIAERLGMAERWVWDSIKLLDLVPEARQHLEHGRITASHGYVLARLTPADQRRAIDPEHGGLFVAEHWLWDPNERAGDGADRRKAVTVRELEGWIATHVRFNVHQASKAAPFDFGQVEEQVAQAEAQPGRGRKVLAITFDHTVHESARDADERTYTPQAWKRADGQDKSKTCASSMLGTVVVGPRYGQAFLVCINKDCEVHWRAEKRERDRTANLRARGEGGKAAQREAAEQQKSVAKQRAADAERAAWQRAAPAIVAALAPKLKTQSLARVGHLALDALPVSPIHRKRALAAYGKPKTADDFLRHAALISLARAIDDWNAHEVFPKVAKGFGLDTAAIVKKHEKANDREA